MAQPPAVPPERRPVRISDADRNRMVDRLRTFCGDGLLTLDEFSERVGLVFDATTRDDLELVVADLPGMAVPVPEAERRKVSRSMIAVMSGSRRTGRWRPGDEFNAFALMGGCEIDLRQAEMDGPELRISAIAIMGGVEIIVPEGIEVDLEGFAFMGSKECRTRDVPRIPGSPVIRVNAFALMGSVVVRHKRSGSERRAVQEARREEARERHAQRHRQARTRQQQRLQQRQQQLEQKVQQTLDRAFDTVGSLGAFDREPPLDPPSPPPGSSWTETLEGHAAPDGTVTILFSDIEGYTETTERLGDLRTHEMLTAHNEIVRAQVAAHGGYEVKNQGDGFMLAFAGASKALRCAIGLQRAFVEHNQKHPTEPIRVRMGLNTGEVVRDGDDFLGRTVILASRVSGEARGGEILASSVVKALADGTGEFMFDVPREVELKGLSQPQTVYPVVWQV